MAGHQKGKLPIKAGRLNIVFNLIYIYTHTYLFTNK